MKLLGSSFGENLTRLGNSLSLVCLALKLAGCGSYEAAEVSYSPANFYTAGPSIALDSGKEISTFYQEGGFIEVLDEKYQHSNSVDMNGRSIMIYSNSLITSEMSDGFSKILPNKITSKVVYIVDESLFSENSPFVAVNKYLVDENKDLFAVVFVNPIMIDLDDEIHIQSLVKNEGWDLSFVGLASNREFQVFTSVIDQKIIEYQKYAQSEGKKNSYRNFFENPLNLIDINSIINIRYNNVLDYYEGLQKSFDDAGTPTIDPNTLHLLNVYVSDYGLTFKVKYENGVFILDQG